MSKARHKKAAGGRTGMKVSGNPDVFKEAEEKKSGGAVKAKKLGFMTGGAVKARMDRPGRKKGGRLGANNAPLSTAHTGHKGSNEEPREQEGGMSD